MENLWYVLPAVPLVLRALLAISFSHYMGQAIPEAALDRADHRTIVFALAGFSFAGLLGLVALPGSLNERSLAIWYVLLSFLALLAVLNVQAYKSKRWHDMLGDALLECATLCLIASVVGFIAKSDLSLQFSVISVVLGAIVWLTDFIIRFWSSLEFYQSKENADGHPKAKAGT